MVLCLIHLLHLVQMSHTPRDTLVMEAYSRQGGGGLNCL